jgi:hypothetical protein
LKYYLTVAPVVRPFVHGGYVVRRLTGVKGQAHVFGASPSIEAPRAQGSYLLLFWAGRNFARLEGSMRYHAASAALALFLPPAQGAKGQPVFFGVKGGVPLTAAVGGDFGGGAEASRYTAGVMAQPSLAVERDES